MLPCYTVLLKALGIIVACYIYLPSLVATLMSSKQAFCLYSCEVGHTICAYLAIFYTYENNHRLQKALIHGIKERHSQSV